MALLWFDGFDRYGTATDAALNYSGSPTSYQSAAGISGAGAFRYSGTSGSTRTFATAGTITAGNGVHMCINVKPGGFAQAQTMLQANTNIGNGQLVVNTDASLSVLIHGSTTVLATSAAGMLASGTYAHVEYAAKYNTSGNGGYIKVWVNGNLVINFSGTSQTGTVPTTFTGMFFGKSLSGGAAVWDYDDPIAWDESGTDFALTQLTTAYLPVIETLSIDADDTVQFTPSTGTNHGAVDDPAFHNSDTDYNSSSTVSQEDLFTVADPATTPAYVFAVALKTVWKIDIAGTINMRDKLKSGATTTYSADRLMTTSYAMATSFFGKDPGTGPAVWATTAPALIKVGYKYQS